jgi:hypothetical protein
VEQSPLVATPPAAKPPNPVARAERFGYVVWGIVVLFVAIPELLAAFWHMPWPTLSETIGHLEQRHHWVRVPVLGGLAVVATRIAFYPWPNRVADPPSR